MLTNQIRIPDFAANDAEAALENLPEQRLTGGAQINQVDGPTRLFCNLLNQRRLLRRGQGTADIDSYVDIALAPLLSYGNRAEHDGELNVGMAPKSVINEG